MMEKPQSDFNKPTFKKISPNSETSREALETERSIDDDFNYRDSSNIWGFEEINSLEQIKSEYFILKKEEKKQARAKNIASLYEKWESLTTNTARFIPLDSGSPQVKLIYDALRDQKTFEALKKNRDYASLFNPFQYIRALKGSAWLELKFQETPTEYEDKMILRVAGDIATKLFSSKERVKKLPQHLKLEMTRAHIRRFRLESQRLQESIEKKYFKRAIRNIENLINQGFCPDFSRQELLGRLEDVKSSVKIDFTDTIMASLEDRYATYSSGNHTINLSINIPPQEIEKTLTHELFHALSGKAMVSFDEVIVQHQRIGLSYGTVKHRFGWLNEGITESLTTQATGNITPNVYTEPQLLLEQLAHELDTEEQSGLTLFYQAYMEHMEPHKGKKVPHWKKLMREINRVYGPGFLVLLDEYIQEHSDQSKRIGWERGTKKALEDFDKYGRGFADFLRKRQAKQKIQKDKG